MTVHVFRAAAQPATRFVDRNLATYAGGKPIVVRIHPRRQLWCWTCDRRRWAKNLDAFVYYDGTRFACRGGCS